MAEFAAIQKAFQAGDIEDFKCLAVRYSTPCTTSLTPGQKGKLKDLLRTPKDDLDLDDIRTIIFELLCEDHQAKNSHYEKQIEKDWHDEFPLVHFSGNRRPSRRSDLSRSPTPAGRQSSSTATSSFSHRPLLSTSISEPPLKQPCFSQPAGQRLQVDEFQRPSTPTLHTVDMPSPTDSGLSSVVKSIEDDTPSKAHGPGTHRLRSAFTISVHDSLPDSLPVEKPDWGTTIHRRDSAPTEPSNSSRPLVGGSVPSDDVFRFGSHEYNVDQYTFEAQGLDLNDHRWGDSTANVVCDMSNSRLLGFFRKPDGTVDKKSIEDEAQASTEFTFTAEDTRVADRKAQQQRGDIITHRPTRVIVDIRNKPKTIKVREVANSISLALYSNAYRAWQACFCNYERRRQLRSTCPYKRRECC